MDTLPGKAERECIACGSSRLSRYGTTVCSRLWVPAQANRRRVLMKCSACGSITVEPKPSNGELETYYENYAKDDHCSTHNTRWHNRAAYKPIMEICNKLGKGRVLDVGCSDGRLLQMLPSSFQKFGIDVSENNRISAREKGVSFIYDSLYAECCSSKFDLIIALDFIEHVDNPGETLNVIGGLLAPGGYVVIETGNAGSLMAKFLKEDWAYTSVYGHVSVLTSGVLSRLAGAAAIKEISIKKGWHSTPQFNIAIYRNILSVGFHLFRLAYRYAGPLAGRVKSLRELNDHAPPGAPHPDHMIFIGTKESR